MILEAQAFSPIHGMAPHPPPSPFSLCVPPFLEPKEGGEQHSNAGEGGEPIRTTGEKAWHSVTLPVPNERKLNRKIRQTCNDHVANKSVHFAFKYNFIMVSP